MLTEFIPIPHKIFPKMGDDGISFTEANITLIQEPDKDITHKMRKLQI